MWTGTGFIEPTVSLSDPNRDQTRASDEFFAGVALAVAAAALIALIQEFSDGTGGIGLRPSSPRVSGRYQTGAPLNARWLPWTMPQRTFQMAKILKCIRHR